MVSRSLKSRIVQNFRKKARSKKVGMEGNVDELGTFFRFMELPTEIRLLIWHYAVPLFPRTILIQPFQCRKPPQAGGGISHIVWTHASLRSIIPSSIIWSPLFNSMWYLKGCEATASSIPTLLSVNQEARYELLRYYTNPFAHWFEDCFEPERLETLLINYDIDNLFITSNTDSKHKRTSEHPRLELYFFPPGKLSNPIIATKFQEAFKNNIFNCRFGCTHGKLTKWLQDFKKLEELARIAERAWELNIGTRSPRIRLQDKSLFGADWERYFMRSMGVGKRVVRGLKRFCWHEMERWWRSSSWYLVNYECDDV